MSRLIVVLVMIFSCSIEEEPSSGISTWADGNRQRGNAPITLERADVNEDGTIDIEDLTAVSYWYGSSLQETRKIERSVQSDLLENPTIEVGKFFQIYVSADLSGGAEVSRRLSNDFTSANGEVDESCKITVELQAIDNEGQVVDKAFAGFDVASDYDGYIAGPMIDETIYRASIYVQSSYPFRSEVYGSFTDSALTNNVKKLIVKSGSICQNKTAEPIEVAQIPVTIAERSDTTQLEARMNNNGNLVLSFTPALFIPGGAEEDDDARGGYDLAVMVVGKDGTLRGLFHNGRGVYRRTFTYYGRTYQAGYSHTGIGTSLSGNVLGYHIHRFRQNSMLGLKGDTRPELCSDGDRVYVLAQETQVVHRMGTFTTRVNDTERVYEGPCTLSGY